MFNLKKIMNEPQEIRKKLDELQDELQRAITKHVSKTDGYVVSISVNITHEAMQSGEKIMVRCDAVVNAVI